MLDIIIVNYQSTDFLFRCLKSIYNSKNGVPFRIIVQDNDSKDSIDRVESSFPDILLSRNRSNLGFAKAVNKGIELGESPYLMLINPDAYIEDNYLFDEFIDYMERNKDVGILGPLIHNPEGTIQGSARAFPSPLTGLFGRNTLLTKWFPNNPISRKNICTDGCNGKKSIDVDWVSGACMVIRREALKDVGFMDHHFFLYWEDADLCKRMWDKNWRVVYSPMFSVTHQIGGSSSANRVRSLIEFHKSSYRLFFKHSRPLVQMTAPLVAFALLSKLSLSVAYNLIKNGSKQREYSNKTKVSFRNQDLYPKNINKKKVSSNISKDEYLEERRFPEYEGHDRRASVLKWS